MRILLLVDCYYLNSKSSVTQMHDLALELWPQEDDVIVLTPSDRVSNDFELTTEFGIQVVRIRTRNIKGASREQSSRGLRGRPVRNWLEIYAGPLVLEPKNEVPCGCRSRDFGRSAGRFCRLSKQNSYNNSDWS